MLFTALQELPFGPLKTEKIKSKIFTIHSRSFLIWSLNYLLSYCLLSISRQTIVQSSQTLHCQRTLCVFLYCVTLHDSSWPWSSLPAILACWNSTICLWPSENAFNILKFFSTSSFLFKWIVPSCISACTLFILLTLSQEGIWVKSPNLETAC